MNNQTAINIILENKKPCKAEKLAAMFACDDIIADDIDVWLNRNVSEYLTQFPDTAESLVKDLLKDDTVSKRQMADGLAEVSRSMYFYVKFHEVLSNYEIALSER